MTDVCLVTGVAGFIGSHLAERLVADGHTVIGVDCFTDQYPRVQKEANLAGLKGRAGFEFVEGDLTRLELLSLMDGVTAVVHLAAYNNARLSWGRDFATYARHNSVATQLLLEAALHVRRFVYASSAAVYGEAESEPTPESATPNPISPYGVSKLAGERLCHAYAVTSAVPTVALRLFNVYGPRQRPDMLISRAIRAGLEERVLEVFGDGDQARDFVFVSDAVDAFAAALAGNGKDEVYNVGSGKTVTVRELIERTGRALGAEVSARYGEDGRGDPRRTCADIRAAGERLGFAPMVSLEAGLQREIEWVRGTAAAS